jgi:tetratricopeptide (TPR) repeat protein
MNIKKKLAILTIFVATFAIALPSAKPFSIYLTQVMHNSRKAEGDRLFKLGEEQIKDNQPKAALESFQKALPIYQQIKERLAEGHTHKSIGNAYFFLKDFPQALTHQQQALSIAREIKNPDLEARALINLGTINSAQGNRSAAIEFLMQSLAIAREHKETQLEVKALGDLAFIYTLNGNHQQSIKLREEQQKILEKTQALWVALLRGEELRKLCSNYEFIENYPQAINCYQQGLKITQDYQKNSDSVIKASNRRFEFMHSLGLGILYQKQYQYQESINYLESARTIYQEFKNDFSFISTFINTGFKINIFNLLGTNYLAIGDTNKAIEYFQQQLSEPNDNIDDKIFAHTNLGLAFFSKNRYDISLEHFNKAIQIAQDKKKPYVEFAVNRSIASRYSLISSIDDAIKYEKKALEIAKKYSNCANQNNSPSQATQDFFSQKEKAISCQALQQGEVQSLSFLGRLYAAPASQKYDFNLGIKYIKQGLELARKLKLADEEATAFRYLGSANSQQGNWKTAIKYYEQALALDRETKDTNNSLQWNSQADLLQTLAINYAASGDLDKAFQIQRNAESLLEKNANSNPHGLAISRSQAGFLSFLAKENKKAEKLFSEAIEKYESILDRGIGNEDANRVQFFDSYLLTYQRLVEVLVAQNRNEEALEISERGRARILTQLLANSSTDLRSRDLKTQTPKISLTQIQQIAKQQNATLVQYQIVYDPFLIIPPSGKNKQPQTPATKILIWVVQPNGKTTFHQSDLSQLLQNKESLETLVQETLVSIRKNATKTRGINQLALKKGDRVRIKEDHSGDPAWIVEDVKNNAIYIRRTSEPAGKIFELSITEVREKVGEHASQTSANARNAKLQQLYRLLIQPIAEELPKQPDARVIFIPHQELFAVPFPALQDSQGKYLIQKQAIATSPSIQVLQLTHQKSQQVSSFEREILLVGNPTMPKVISTSGELKPLPSLTNAEAEVKAIAPLFQSKPKPII